MAKQKALVAWIGYADLRALWEDLPGDKRKKLEDELKGKLPRERGLGPIRTLLQQESFYAIHLLTTYSSWINSEFHDWLGYDPIIRSVDLKDPTDYDKIFKVADQELKCIILGFDEHAPELCILLTPGTPAMAAVWVLLGKSKYPARFFQTHESRGAWETHIPFDLTVDFLPEIMRNANSSFHHLADCLSQDIEGFGSIIGNGEAMRKAKGDARKAAFWDVPVLLLGETGTGKELFARAIHASSSRKDRPFIPINCAAIPRDLIESELFGHEKGAFTGAESKRDGAFKMADKGILFLDEVGECDLNIQAKLLRVLQPTEGREPCQREFRPLGSKEVVESNVRAIAATNRNLLKSVEDGSFRADLYYRLAPITIRLPPLRERREDIPTLADVILRKINGEFTTQQKRFRPKSLSSSAKNFLLHHSWVGNIRELQNALLQSVVMSDKDELSSSDLEAAVSNSPTGQESDILNLPLGNGFSLDQHLDSIKEHYIRRAMKESGGNKAKATRLLGYKGKGSRLDYPLNKLGIERKSEQ